MPNGVCFLHNGTGGSSRSLAIRLQDIVFRKAIFQLAAIFCYLTCPGPWFASRFFLALTKLLFYFRLGCGACKWSFLSENPIRHTISLFNLIKYCSLGFTLCFAKNLFSPSPAAALWIQGKYITTDYRSHSLKSNISNHLTSEARFVLFFFFSIYQHVVFLLNYCIILYKHKLQNIARSQTWSKVLSLFLSGSATIRHS